MPKQPKCDGERGFKLANPIDWQAHGEQTEGYGTDSGAPVPDGLSQASSNFGYSGKDDLTSIMAEFATQRVENNKSPGSSYDQVPPTQTSAGSSNMASSSLSASRSLSTLGKRRQDGNSEVISPVRPFKQSRSAPMLHIPSGTTDDSYIAPPNFLQGKGTSPVTDATPLDLSWPPIMDGWFEKIPYGARWETCRAIEQGRHTNGLGAKYTNFTSILFEDILLIASKETSAKAAPFALKYFASCSDDASDDTKDEYAQFYAREVSAHDPWEELDLEEAALASGNPLANLGFNADGTHAGRYGGKVEFRGTICDVPGARKGETELKVRLERPTLGPSTQLSRRFGSKNFFRLKISKVAASHKDLFSLIVRPFIICGCVFRAFYAKENNVFFVKTNEDVKRMPDANPLIKDAMSFIDFLNFHNPLEENRNQKMAKWASRFALGLSNSVPGYLLTSDGVQTQNDIESQEGSCMTDGAGSITENIMHTLKEVLGWERAPNAIQVRLWGSKGLCVVANDIPYNVLPTVWVTPSQIKIKYPRTGCDPAHLVIDVLRASHMKSPCRLSVEVIVNLAENGVPESAFTTLLETSLTEIVTPLLDWDSPNAAPTLWMIVQSLGGVLAARRARENASTARVNGFSERDNDETELDDEDGFTQLDFAEQRSAAWWADPISGCPSSLEETVMALLDSGFTPNNCVYLREKLRQVIKSAIKNFVKTYRMEVPMSCSAWIVPDRLGVLKEGEIYFKPSSNQLRGPDGRSVNEILGDVLITRNPCKLPTDVQKMKAVFRPELRHLTDVIVMSTQGSRRAADWLAGGDYDGDKAVVFWDQTLVAPFKNADKKHGDPPTETFLKDNFVAENISVPDFQREIAHLPEASRIRQFQEHLLGAVRDTSIVGKYSNFHENCVFRKGYDDAETIRLAHMFCSTLDGAKSGLKVKPEILKEDNRRYNHKPPAWKAMLDAEEKVALDLKYPNQANPQRRQGLSRFIMDRLAHQAKVLDGRFRTQVDEHYDKLPYRKSDDTLTAVYRDIVRRSDLPGGEGYKEDLALIRTHVEELYSEHRRMLGACNSSDSNNLNASPSKGYTPKTSSRKPPGEKSPQKAGAAFTLLPIEKRQDILRALSKQFASSPNPQLTHMPKDLLNRVKASYAYYYDYQKNPKTDFRFAFDVAFRELCAMKAQTMPAGFKVVSNEFYEKFSLKLPKTWSSAGLR